MKNIRFFYLKNFMFLVVKLSVYLNRHVFVIYRGSFELVFESLGNSSDSSRNQLMFRDRDFFLSCNCTFNILLFL